MATLKIEGIPPYDGDYPFSIEKFSGNELHEIKLHTGLRAGEFPDAIKAGDYDMVIAVAWVCLHRAGQQVTIPELMALDLGQIAIDASDDVAAEDAERPPVTATPGGPPNAPDVAQKLSASPEPSGPPSVEDGDPNQNGLRATGIPGSETPAALLHPILDS